MEQPIIAKREVTRHILKAHNLRADKRLGQNFLIDEKIVKKIVEAAELKASDTVLEVGPGIGTLTQGLALTGASVVAVELDKRLLPGLAKTLGSYENINIINEDILKLDILSAVGGKSFKAVANLPYYITTPIIFSLLEQKLPLELLVLSVAINYYTEPRIAFLVPPDSFVPAPAVDSAVIVCRRRKLPPVAVNDEKLFFRVVKAAFSVRRKMLSNALRNMGLSPERTNFWLEKAGIDGRRRGETLSLAEFAALANSFEQAKNS